jgi:hypothetical protein
MDKGTLIVVFNIVSVIYGVYLMLTSHRGPIPKRRFLIGAICVLGGAAIAAYQYSKL